MHFSTRLPPPSRKPISHIYLKIHFPHLVKTLVLYSDPMLFICFPFLIIQLLYFTRYMNI